MTLHQDLKYAVRALRRSPGFTAVAILILGLGIGANSAIFSVINAVLLQPLPYQEPDRLVSVEHHYPSLNDLLAPVSVIGFINYEKQSQLFASAAVETGLVPTLTGRGDPTRIQGARVSGNFFPTYGVAPILGRALRPDETQAGHDKVVVISYGLWQRVFGGDSSAVGQRVILDGESYAVVGVMPAEFRGFFGRRAEFWVPFVFPPRLIDESRWTNEFLSFTGRLRPGVTLEQARSDIAAYGVRLRTDNPDRFGADWGLVLTSLNEKARGPLRSALLLLLGAVALVLLIACANVASLQLARAAARAREVAVRVALGASPLALMRQLLTESVLLALAGGALGLLLALWGVPALLSLNSGQLPAAGDIRLDGRVLGFTLVLSLVTGLVFGAAPALRVARTSLHETLKEGGRGSAGERHGLALRRGLVIATVALALTLLAGAGLLVRSFARLVGVDPGFRPDHLLTFNVSLPTLKYPSDTVQIAAHQRIVAALGALPGVASVGATTVMPFGGSWSTASFSVEGYQPPANTPGPWGDMRTVTAGFLPTVGAPLLRGRQLSDQDVGTAPAVVVVDAEMARRYWPNQDPIGKRVTFNSLSDSVIQWIEVVGVVGHTMHEGLDAQPRVQLYFPLQQNGQGFLAYALRTTGDPRALIGPVRAALASVDPDLPMTAVNSMEELIDGTTGPRRFAMLLLGAFSLLAAGLAAIGLYGVMAYTVTQRSKELGVRLALGAGAPDVLRLVLGQGMRLALIGVGIGLAGALLGTRLLRGMLFNVSAADPGTFLSITALLLLVTAVATWLPARRATRVDPAVVLREE